MFPAPRSSRTRRWRLAAGLRDGRRGGLPLRHARAAAWLLGRYTQSPGYEKLLQSDYFVDLSAAVALDLRSERALHVLGSIAKDLTPGLTTRVEAYYKSFDRLIVGRLETPAETAARTVVFQPRTPRGNFDILRHALDASGTPAVLLGSPFDEKGLRFAPDGHAASFLSDETGPTRCTSHRFQP